MTVSIGRITNGVITSTVFVILFSSIGVSNVYAEELSYDDKLEFIFKIKQITGHMVSALGNIDNNEFTLAKMHLIHPVAQHSDIVDFLPEDSICSQKLSLTLTILQHTEPEYDQQDIYKRFSHVFKILNSCTDLVVGVEMHPNFYINLTDKLLEQSIVEYEASTHVEGMGKKMKYQDALGLIIRAHMLIKSDSIVNVIDYDNIQDPYQDLFLAYQNNARLYDIMIMTNHIRDIISTDNSISFQDSTEKYDLIIPTVYLKTSPYTNGLKTLELNGENFDANEKVTIEYVDSENKKLETIRGTVTSGGEFSIPFDIVHDSFDESMMFTITVGDIVLYPILSIS